MISKNFSKSVIGLSLIAFIIWNRIIRINNPQQFNLLNANEILYYMGLSGIAAIIFMFLFIHSLKKIYSNNNKSGVSENKYYIKYVKFINIYIIDSPVYVYNIITKNMNLAAILEYPASFFTAHLNYPRIFVISFYFIPQLLVALTFFIEVSFFHQRIFFFKVLSLLIIFLVAKIIIFSFRHYSDRRLKHYDLFLDVEKNDEGYHISLKPPHALPEHIPLEQIVNQYNTMYLYWIIYKNINTTMLNLDNFNNQNKHYINLITFFLFSLGWLSLFLFLFNLYIN